MSLEGCLDDPALFLAKVVNPLVVGTSVAVEPLMLAAEVREVVNGERHCRSGSSRPRIVQKWREGFER